jgi:RNA polymerase sigma-70 factor, ECF subfamily
MHRFGTEGFSVAAELPDSPSNARQDGAGSADSTTPATSQSLRDPSAYQDMTTRPSVFMKLKATDPAPRELAWQEFYDRYAPLIASYARRKGVVGQQADEIVQDVMLGFFAASPKFVYDPNRGHFRGYLRTCVGRALRRQREGDAKHRVRAIPLDEIDVQDQRAEDPADLKLWDDLWERQQLHRILDEVREHYRRKGRIETFLAFERNVLFGESPEAIAADLGISVPSVHMAKMRVTRRLSEKKAKMSEEEG